MAVIYDYEGGPPLSNYHGYIQDAAKWIVADSATTTPIEGTYSLYKYDGGGSLG